MKDKFEQELKKAGLFKLFNDIEMPLTPVLAAMEEAGIKLDVKVLAEIKRSAAKRLAELDTRIHKLAGAEFNVASPQQLEGVLF